MLRVRDLRVAVVDGGAEIIKGLDLEVNAGEVHAIMGPNGSGKSTLANVLAGRIDYEVTGGEILLDGEEHHRHACQRAGVARHVPGIPVSRRGPGRASPGNSSRPPGTRLPNIAAKRR